LSIRRCGGGRWFWNLEGVATAHLVGSVDALAALILEDCYEHIGQGVVVVR
jgi:hypothetical protein